MPQPDHHIVLQDFFNWERKSWIEVVSDINTDEKSHFMPPATLKAYFQENDGKKLNKILSEAFESDDIPVDSEVIIRGYSAVFCILLRIGKGKYIEYFVQYEELSDHRLPFDPENLPARFPVATDDPEFPQRFCEKQWMYCVPTFDRPMLDKRFEHNRLLPITYKERCAGGRSAIIYKITLYGPHNKLLQDNSQLKMNDLAANTLTLKRYVTKDAENQYTQEVQGYRKVGYAASVIGFYGSYIHGDSYNILLEFADKGNLEEYFRNESPPSNREDIVKFWEGLFQLIKALRAIHSTDAGPIFQGWHQDVKPTNILVISHGEESTYDWKFKLADLGLSHFAVKAVEDEEATTKDAQGPRTYGAPECYRSDDMIHSSLKVKQSVDIWSLGCVYSEAAMWVADGYKGVLNYRQRRMAETSKIPNFRDRDCFHNGIEVLDAVGDAHRDIEKRLRRSDHITKMVLDLMVDEMLWVDDRPNAKALWHKAQSILKRERESQLPSTGDLPTRPNSEFRSFPYARPRTPPQRPKAPPPGLPFVQRQYALDDERWFPLAHQLRDEQASPAIGGEQYCSPESISELDKEISGSIASWQHSSPLTTPLTSPLASPPTSPLSSSHSSKLYDNNKHLSSEGMLRPLQGQGSSGLRRSNGTYQRLSYGTADDLLDDERVVPIKLDIDAEILQENVARSPKDDRDNGGSSVDNLYIHVQSGWHATADDASPITGQTFQSEDVYCHVSQEPPELPPKSRKRRTVYAPLPSPSAHTDHQDLDPIVMPVTEAASQPDMATIHDELLSNNLSAPVSDAVRDETRQVECLSLTEALEWKKQSKKRGKTPPLPGAHLLDELRERDHIFIIDDASSMTQQWDSVKNVFEALSYIVKAKAPDGIELFFTVSYETYRRHNTTELLELLDKKELSGRTDISYRLRLQLESYAAKIQGTRQKKRSSKPTASKKFRPMSIYILTDGQWKPEGDPVLPIKEMARELVGAELKNGQVAIQMISFGQDVTGLRKMSAMAKTEFGLDIVDTTPSDGNVLKMLLGALDKSRFQDLRSLSSGTSSASTLAMPGASTLPV